MYQNITQFIQLLRNNDIRISLAEELDCLHAIQIIPLLNKSLFFYTLRSTLIKFKKHYALFKILFDKFFSTSFKDSSPINIDTHLLPKKGIEFFQEIQKFNLIKTNSQWSEKAPIKSSVKKVDQTKKYGPQNKRTRKLQKKSGIGTGSKHSAPIGENTRPHLLDRAAQQKLAQLLKQIFPKRTKSEDLLCKIFTASKTELKQLACQIAEDINIDSKPQKDTLYHYQSKYIRRWDQSRDQINQFQNSKSSKGAESNINWTTLTKPLSKMLFKLATTIKQEKEMKSIAQTAFFNLDYFKNLLILNLQLKYLRENSRRAYVSDHYWDYNEMDYDDGSTFKYSKEMQLLVEKLAYKLATRASLRDKRIFRGTIDIKKTIRKSLKYLGHPMALHFKKRRITKPEIVILCDVSGSVKYATGFFLLFLSHLAKAFSKVHTFLFVSLIDKIELSNTPLNFQDIKHTMRQAKIDFRGYSDFGEAFSLFNELYKDLLNYKTTMIILGDARNNMNEANEEILAEWKSKINKLLWLNPEPKVKWNTGDSIMSVYAKNCDLVVECATPEDLAKIIDRYILV